MLQRPLTKSNTIQMECRMFFESFFPVVSDGFELIHSPYYLVSLMTNGTSSRQLIGFHSLSGGHGTKVTFEMLPELKSVC